MFVKAAVFNAIAGAVSAEILWDGRFNNMTSSAELADWSWSNQVGPYQYYIHGSGAVTDYVNLDASYKNPADTGSNKGAKITIDETSKWEGQSMLRTELIPQTTAAINKGKVYYHFSVKTTTENAPTTTEEHQVAFFESHFTELKYGVSGSGLQWCVGGTSKWDTELVADEWHNVAYEIDFDAGSVSFYHSTGSEDLAQAAGPFDASTSSNAADWHLGVLRLPGSSDTAGAEDWYFSGVYIESGELTTSVVSPGGSASGDDSGAVSSAAAASSAASSSSAAPSSSAALASSAAPSSSTAPSSSAAPASSSVPSVSSAPATSAAAETRAASSTGAEAAETSVPASSSSAPASSAAAPSSTAVASAPAASPSGDALPEEFTIEQFVAWLKEETGTN